MATSVCISSDNLEVDESGRLRVKHDCSLVDGAGGLALPALDVLEYDTSGTTSDTTIPDGGAQVQLGPGVTVELTNPSTCRNMRVQTIFQDKVSIVVDDGDQIQVHQRWYVNALPYFEEEVQYWGDFGRLVRNAQRNSITRWYALGPGATLSIVGNLQGQKVSGTGASYMEAMEIEFYMHGTLM
jgi:hypothetical protein